jgi:hypothetical protein
MVNDFNRQVEIAFMEEAQKFFDSMIFSKTIEKYNITPVTAERSKNGVVANDVINLPIPPIRVAQSGVDATGLIRDITDMTVPVAITDNWLDGFALDRKNHRDPNVVRNQMESSREALGSKVNQIIADKIVNQATMVVKDTTTATFTGITKAAAMMDRLGVPFDKRYMALAPNDTYAIANALTTNAGQLTNNTTEDALRRNTIGDIHGFDVLKSQYTKELAAAAATGVTFDTRTATGNKYVPAARDANGLPKDNRYQTITVSSTTNVAAGDAFTIAGVYEVHPIAKRPTKDLKTFRVISVDTGTTMTISPPFISAQGSPSDAEIHYQNCNIAVANESATAAITFLNTVDTDAAPFWHPKGCMLVPGRVPLMNGMGAREIEYVDEASGMQLVLTETYDGLSTVATYVLRVYFGVAVVRPDMVGIELFNQT